MPCPCGLINECALGVAGLLFFELMFLTFRSMFTALFTFPDGPLLQLPSLLQCCSMIQPCILVCRQNFMLEFDCVWGKPCLS